jgi:hypothetical protein
VGSQRHAPAALTPGKISDSGERKCPESRTLISLVTVVTKVGTFVHWQTR